MRVSIVGSGYVGTKIAACFAEFGHQLINVDIEQDIVETINAGETPIHEPGLEELLSCYGGDSLVATSNYDNVIDTDITFLALPTPVDNDGHIDT